ncbi:GNAT family N-acetyltransferase [Aphanothece hegewaldii CCALA 016]|uniref:GNAT family N-acetyltransferase n=1 Tax=Aphanothece hegewaldii CCALA 016 TaxID=2107694 RepID=A0A2T1M1J8_9CHRO|nr:GNAT family N-acetyltransferase [Aphanothece hegewaldii]PSF38573.1 GNAT family N-acetyltransferase [Aphanothece hegewaldii CCALA 016]
MSEIIIRLLQEQELAKADQIFRLAFGTFIGLPDPMQFESGAAHFPHRWKTEPSGAFAAQMNQQLVGSILGVHWGSFAFFGPLSVHPDFWAKGIAKSLVAAEMERFEAWGIQQAGLFTFPNSSKHHGLYQKFGFYPQFLTPVMAKSIQPLKLNLSQSCYSQFNESEKAIALFECQSLTDAIYDGLDLSKEIQAVDTLKLGDTVMLWDNDRLLGFAVCHCGQGTEAGHQTCFVKFGAIRPTDKAGEHFERLLELCEAFSFTQGLTKLRAGVNTSRHEAYCTMLNLGFRTEITGVAMQKPNKVGFNRPDVFVLDDWR